MSILSGDNLREQQRINELEQKIKREKDKLNKRQTRQKILLGAFFIDALENDRVSGLRSYTAQNLEEFLPRKNDRALMSEVIAALKKPVIKPTPKEQEQGQKQEQGNDEGMFDGNTGF